MRYISFVWLSPFLTRASARFGIDAHYFAKNSAIVTAGHMVSIMRGLVTGYLVTRLFSPELYGQYKFVVSIVGTVGVFALSGLPTAIARAVATEKDRAPLRFTMWIYALFCSLGAIILLGAIPLLHIWNRIELWPLFLVAGLFFIPSNIASIFFGGIVIGSSSFMTSLRTSLISSSIVIVAVLAMLLYHQSPLILLAIVTGVPAIVYLTQLTSLLKKFPSHERSARILKYGAWLTLADIPTSLSWYLDGLIISAFFGLDQLALFSVAILIPEQVKVFFKELMPVTFRKQADGVDSKGRREKLLRGVLLLTLLIFIGASVYSFITPFVISFLFPLYPAKDLIFLTNVAAFMLLGVPSGYFVQFLQARGLVRQLQYSQWLAAAIFIMALILIIPSYGPVGAIIARGLFRIAYGGIAFILMQMTPLERTGNGERRTEN